MIYYNDAEDTICYNGEYVYIGKPPAILRELRMTRSQVYLTAAKFSSVRPKMYYRDAIEYITKQNKTK